MGLFGYTKKPWLSPGQVSLLIIAGIVAFVALFCFAFLVMQMRSRLGGSSIYDRRLVEEKTARPAYRVRLRLFVFSTSPDRVAAVDCLSRWVLVRHLFRWPLDTASWLQSYQSWRAASKLHTLERATRVQVLDQLAAAYRQYHTASGGYFVPRHLSQRKARRILSTRRAHLPGWSGRWNLFLEELPVLAHIGWRDFIQATGIYRLDRPGEKVLYIREIGIRRVPTCVFSVKSLSERFEDASTTKTPGSVVTRLS